MAATDSPALLATLAGAGTTIVAIVAGLLVSSYVTLDSERRNVEGRLSDVGNQLSAARSQRDVATKNWNVYRIDEALDTPDVYKLLYTHAVLTVNASKSSHSATRYPLPSPIPVEDVSRAARVNDLDDTILRETVNAWTIEADNVLENLRGWADGARREPGVGFSLSIFTLRDFRQRYSIDPRFGRLRDEMYLRQREQLSTAQQPTPTSLSSAEQATPRLDVRPDPPRLSPIPTSPRPWTAPTTTGGPRAVNGSGVPSMKPAPAWQPLKSRPSWPGRQRPASRAPSRPTPGPRAAGRAAPPARGRLRRSRSKRPARSDPGART